MMTYLGILLVGLFLGHYISPWVDERMSDLTRLLRREATDEEWGPDDRK